MSSNRARTRAIRHRMAETGETYTQAARAMNAVPRDHAPARQTDQLRSIVTNLVQADLAYDSLLEAERRQLEAAGHRLIGGGQTSGERWEITDVRTGELIAEGDGGIDGFDATTERLDPEGKWVHIDQIKTTEIDPFDVAVDRLVQQGIPRGLIAAIGEWATFASDEELENYLGSATAAV